MYLDAVTAPTAIRDSSTVTWPAAPSSDIVTVSGFNDALVRLGEVELVATATLAELLVSFQFFLFV